jgi:hypothetical protein
VSPVVTVRPVWYREGVGAASFDSVAAGKALYGRGPDAWGAYMIEPNGKLVHLFDTPVSSILAHAANR